MDVVLLNSSLFSLPPSQRAGAIVYDGTTDLGLWRPPGPDRELVHEYGETLAAVLNKERAQLRGKKLELGQALRVSPGKLRCDYLIWVASRPPHGEAEPAPAPALEAIAGLVKDAFAVARKHGTLRLALGAFGTGKGAADAGERMAAVVRAAAAFRSECQQQGLEIGIEEVLVCSESAADVAKARRLVARLTRAVPVAAVPVSSAARSSSSVSARGTRSAARRPGTPHRGRQKLDPTELASARVRAAVYDRGHVYIAGEWFIHPTFGAGRVQTVLGPERMVTALFEDGEERRLIHARS